LEKEKFWPVVISTSRGMGKTFLLKKLALQHVGPHLKSPLIADAFKLGRVLSFDFVKQPNAIQKEDDVYTFFPRLMIFYLCRILADSQVDNINFEATEFRSVMTHSGEQPNFNNWLQKVRRYDTESMMQEYIRLTNIAFKANNNAPISPLVFLLDEIQLLCIPTSVASRYSKVHSRLSLLLTQLAGKIKPLCVCTGTNSGKIISITEKSAILPQVISLTPLVQDYFEYWTQLTAYAKQKDTNTLHVQMDTDKDLIDALVYASYQIPRLLFLAHTTWFEGRRKGSAENRLFFIQQFEQQAIDYYDEMVHILKLYNVKTIAHIILACGVHWKVRDVYSNVPGTETTWSELIEKSLIFPYLDDCYLFPFSLIWNVALSPDTTNNKAEIETLCSQLVSNLDVRDIFLSYDILCAWENYNFGVGFETLFASSLAVKYYLVSLATKSSEFHPFTAIYDVDSSEKSYKILEKFAVNFSQGISLPETEAFVNSVDSICAVIHNKKIHNAHHDIILPSTVNGKKVNIAVQAKASFDLSSKKTVEKQLCVSPHVQDQVQLLLWLYLGEENKENMYRDVAFLDGSGCCNGLALDFFILIKKLKAQSEINYS
jgi:hypothetical protein